jgi:hypothetical protein
MALLLVIPGSKIPAAEIQEALAKLGAREWFEGRIRPFGGRDAPALLREAPYFFRGRYQYYQYILIFLLIKRSASVILLEIRKNYALALNSANSTEIYENASHTTGSLAGSGKPSFRRNYRLRPEQ